MASMKEIVSNANVREQFVSDAMTLINDKQNQPLINSGPKDANEILARLRKNRDINVDSILEHASIVINDKTDYNEFAESCDE